MQSSTMDTLFKMCINMRLVLLLVFLLHTHNLSYGQNIKEPAGYFNISIQPLDPEESISWKHSGDFSVSITCSNAPPGLYMFHTQSQDTAIATVELHGQVGIECHMENGKEGQMFQLVVTATGTFLGRTNFTVFAEGSELNWIADENNSMHAVGHHEVF